MWCCDVGVYVKVSLISKFISMYATNVTSHVPMYVHSVLYQQKSPSFPERTGVRPHQSSPALLATTHRDIAAMDGILFKRGKIVKNWKSRYFVLNSESKEVSN